MLDWENTCAYQQAGHALSAPCTNNWSPARKECTQPIKQQPSGFGLVVPPLIPSFPPFVSIFSSDILAQVQSVQANLCKLSLHSQPLARDSSTTRYRMADSSVPPQSPGKASSANAAATSPKAEPTSPKAETASPRAEAASPRAGTASPRSPGSPQAVTEQATRPEPQQTPIEVDEGVSTAL